jgi:hypothetical protein
MSGKIVIADADGTEIDGGNYWEGRRTPGDYRWSRFRLTFDDGGMHQSSGANCPSGTPSRAWSRRSAQPSVSRRVANVR